MLKQTPEITMTPYIKYLKSLTIVTCIVTSIPVFSQKEDWEALQLQNLLLERRIDSLRMDTLSYADKLCNSNRKIDSLNQELQQLDSQLIAKQSCMSDAHRNLMHTEIDSLAIAETKLQARKVALSKLKKQKEDSIDRLYVELGRLQPIVKKISRHKFEENNNLLHCKYSTISDVDIETMMATITDYADFVGYDEYVKRVKATYKNKNLYNRAISALNTRYDSVTIDNLRTELWQLFDVKKDDINAGRFALNSQQFAELDSLDIKLSRYAGGIRELQSIVQRVNSDQIILNGRISRNKNVCIDQMRLIVTRQTDNEAVFSRYFDMIPYLDKLLQDYWKELKRNPLARPTTTEKIINQLGK